MIYFIQADVVGHIKVGFVEGDCALQRLSQLQVGSPMRLRLLGTLPGCREIEAALHRCFADVRVRGEWFEPVPGLLRLIGDQGPKIVPSAGCKGRPSTAKYLVKRWLLKELALGPRMALDLLAAAAAVGISERTLRRVKKRMGIQSRKSSADGPWVWFLPEATCPPPNC